MHMAGNASSGRFHRILTGTLGWVAVAAAAAVHQHARGDDVDRSVDRDIAAQVSTFDPLDSLRRAYMNPVDGLDPADVERFFRARRWFAAVWLPPDETLTEPFRGLGPSFNATSCADCHLRNGRGLAPTGPPNIGFAVLLSHRDGTSCRSYRAYGNTLNYDAVDGHRDGDLLVDARPVRVVLAGADPAELLEPQYRLVTRRGTDDDAVFSVRMAPAVYGLGLLEAVDDATILAFERENRRASDGIAGRANRIRFSGRAPRVGRFGWKAAYVSLEQQAAASLNEEMGITSALRPAEDGSDQAADGSPEISSEGLANLALYLRMLDAPRPRDGGDGAAIARGAQLFAAVGCARCHRPEVRTSACAAHPVLANRVIRPYTDLLVHDMGSALADELAQSSATGREWRTAPLWGIGRAEEVLSGARYLHDGRARSLAEAILWHGGEAEAARTRFAALPRPSREDLLAFLRSL